MESMENFCRPPDRGGPAGANPAVFPNTVYNAAGGQVAMHIGAVGPRVDGHRRPRRRGVGAMLRRRPGHPDHADAMLASAPTPSPTPSSPPTAGSACSPGATAASARGGGRRAAARTARPRAGPRQAKPTPDARLRHHLGRRGASGASTPAAAASSGRCGWRWSGPGGSRATSRACGRARRAWRPRTSRRRRPSTGCSGPAALGSGPVRSQAAPRRADGRRRRGQRVLASMSLRRGHTAGPALVTSSSLGGTHIASYSSPTATSTSGSVMAAT